MYDFSKIYSHKGDPEIVLILVLVLVLGKNKQAEQELAQGHAVDTLL